MNAKKIAIVLGIILLSFAIVGSASAFNLFGGPTTDFDNKFMSGTFTGDVSRNNISTNDSLSDWVDSYEDKERNITYNMSCIKGGSFLTDLYELQGMAAPEVRNFNGADWKVYYSQAVPTTDENKTANESSVINVYICEADVDNVTYMINIIAYDNESIDCDGSLYCGFFKDDIQPLLESITLKDAKKAPQIYDILNMTKDDFKQLQDYIEQVKTGNIPETAEG